MEAPVYTYTTNRHTDTPMYTSQKTWLLDALHQTSTVQTGSVVMFPKNIVLKSILFRTRHVYKNATGSSVSL